MEIPTSTPHPLKPEIKKTKLRLWQVKKMLGGSPSESELSKMLSGQKEMPADVASGLKNILSEIKQPLVSVK